MQNLSLSTFLAAPPIAVTIVAIAGAPSQAADYRYVPYPDTDDWAYSETRLQLPDLDRAYRRDAPAYHYAYYAIARPEYLLD